MDFSWSDVQIEFKNSTIRFAQKELNHNYYEKEKFSQFNRESWQKCADFGIQGLPVPAKYGGLEADILTTTYVLEGLGYGCRDKGLIFSINAQLWTCTMPLLEFGTSDQKNVYLQKLCNGQFIGGNSMTEPNSGSDAFSLTTRAEKKGKKYYINGRKTWCTNGNIADVILVFATTNPAAGFLGITCFLVAKDTKGLNVSRSIDKMGLRTSPTAELVFEDCEVSEDHILGKVGQGRAIFNTSMEWERSSILASNIGAMEYQLQQCILYAKHREQFGRSIGKFQSISNKISDMKIRLEAAKLLLYRAAWLKMNGHDVTIDAAIAKIFLSESFIQSSLDAIQIHGAYGYATEFEIERDLRDAIAGPIYSGTNEILRNMIFNFIGS
jgi:hypothetical protein